MSAFQSNDPRGAGLMALTAAVLMFISSPAPAIIVFDGQYRVAADAATQRLHATSLGYSSARSHAWMSYRNSAGHGIGNGRGLVAVPLRGAWMASSASQASVRVNVARAQAYRMGGQE